MKKIAFTLAGLLVIMLTGCGEGSSTSSPTTQNVNNNGTPPATSNPVDARGLTQFPAVPAIPE